jgi:serine phosphatase RsbU (regulator of sigma subunit)
MNVAEDFFGEDRLLGVLAPFAASSAAEIVDAVMKAVRAFAAGAVQNDDITVLAARVLAASSEVTRDSV